jgi:putative component of toxin-antitoxin plasmid stabilization module
MLECNWESANRRYRTAQTDLLQSKVKEVLRELHSGSSGDHLDIRKTLNKVRQQYTQGGDVKSVTPAQHAEVLYLQLGQGRRDTECLL